MKSGICSGLKKILFEINDFLARLKIRQSDEPSQKQQKFVVRGKIPQQLSTGMVDVIPLAPGLGFLQQDHRIMSMKVCGYTAADGIV
jgi:hypothetical protein